MNKQFDELIAKHLKGTLQEDEKQLLAMLLKVPENQFYLASKIDEQFLDESLEEVGDEKMGNQIFQGIQQELKEVIPHQSIEQPEGVVQMTWYRKKIIRLIAVAASIILVIGLGIVLFNNKHDEQSIAVQNNKRLDSVAGILHHEVNTTGKQKRIQLPDGSLILLANKSEITYREPFTNKRDITLIGKAYFKVAKDKTRPFTVFSGAISTTALGTEFTVTAFEKSNQITVRLYEGKVVVKAVDKGDKKLRNEVYLLPGQAFVYGSNSAVKKFKVNKAAPEAIINDELSNDNPSIPQDAKGSWYMFNNETLGGVLDQLSAMYNVQIVYKKKDVENIYFTGKYNQSDSIENILNDIAILHNLTITSKGNEFIVSK
jgi:transmembrane sensor